MASVQVGGWVLLTEREVTDSEEITQAKAFLAQAVETIEEKEVAQDETA